MNRRMTALITAIAAPVAFAQTADLTVDEANSSASAEICLTPPALGTECDTDSSSIGGSLEIELDDYGSPSGISIYDFALALNQTMNYNMDWGPLFGGVNIELTGVTVSYATPGVPTGPVGVSGAGDFEFPSVQAVLTGVGAYEGYGLVIGPLVGSGSFNLADFGAVESAIAGNVQVFGSEIFLSGAQAFQQTGEINGVEASIDGSATLLATGTVPEPDCRVDINGDGSVNTLDFIAYLGLWSAGDPSADFNDDGTVNTQDFLVFLGEWAAGC